MKVMGMLIIVRAVNLILWALGLKDSGVREDVLRILDGE